MILLTVHLGLDDGELVRRPAAQDPHLVLPDLLDHGLELGVDLLGVGEHAHRVLVPLAAHHLHTRCQSKEPW